jgi:hypothetical protein
MDISYAFKCNLFRNIHHTETLGIPLQSSFSNSLCIRVYIYIYIYTHTSLVCVFRLVITLYMLELSVWRLSLWSIHKGSRHRDDSWHPKQWGKSWERLDCNMHRNSRQLPYKHLKYSYALSSRFIKATGQRSSPNSHPFYSKLERKNWNVYTNFRFISPNSWEICKIVIGLRVLPRCFSTCIRWKWRTSGFVSEELWCPQTDYSFVTHYRDRRRTSYELQCGSDWINIWIDWSIN